MTAVHLIEPEDFAKLRGICERLHGGSDKMRDEGHRLWLVLDRVLTVPAPVDPSVTHEDGPLGNARWVLDFLIAHTARTGEHAPVETQARVVKALANTQLLAEALRFIVDGKPDKWGYGAAANAMNDDNRVAAEAALRAHEESKHE